MSRQTPGLRSNPATTHPNAGIASWRFKLAAEIHSYEDANKFLGDSTFRKLAASMQVERVAEGQIGIRLYKTLILVYRDDGTFWADNGGWNTPTTTNRLNTCAPGPYGAWFFSHARKRLHGNDVEMRAGEWHSVAGEVRS